MGETGSKLPDTGSPVCSSSSVANNNRCYGISQEKPSRNSVFLSENVDRLDNSNESFAFPTIKDKMSTPSLVPLSNSLESNNLEDSYTSPIDTKHSSLINSGGAVDSNLNKHVEYTSERTISKYDVDSNEPSNVDVDEGSSGINHLTNEFEKNYTAKTEKMEQTNQKELCCKQNHRFKSKNLLVDIKESIYDSLHNKQLAKEGSEDKLDGKPFMDENGLNCDACPYKRVRNADMNK